MFHAGKTAFQIFILCLIGGLSWAYTSLHAQSIAQETSGVETLSVNTLNVNTPSVYITVDAGKHYRMNTPVSASLNDFPLHLADYDLQLVETTKGQEKPVASQLETGYQPQLYWVLTGETPAGSSRTFKLSFISKNSSESEIGAKVKAEDTGEAVQLKVGDSEVLAYHYGLTPEPAGSSPLYRRGGYIHPLKSPNGGVLTRVQPPDHYHHYGIWNPWTHTEYKGEEIDFWNIYKGQGTVQVKDVPFVTEGDVYGKVTALHEHVVLDTLNAENNEVALNEEWDIRVWNTAPEADIFLVDFVSTMNAPNSPLTIKEYRYQGFGFRANAQWDDQTATLVTSEGYDKSDGNSTRARWCYIDGPTDAGNAGVLFMTSPVNYNYPEQLRIWPTGANDGKENVFFNFNPAQDRDWTLQPGKAYSLKYRMMVYDGEIDSASAERYWNDFANPPKVKVSVVPSLAGKKVLVYTKNGEGFVHDNIPASIEALKKLGKENGFEVVASEDPSLFTEEDLQQYDAMIFSNTNNDVFDTEAQEKAFQEYIRSGGGFVGIHSASGSERDWPWFAQMLGGRFLRHPPRQDFDVHVLDKNHPSTSFLPDVWKVEMDECYYLKHLNPGNHVLLAADLTTVEDERRGEYPDIIFGDQFPLAWYHEFDGGRQWYTALGHRIEHYSDPTFMRHILGGIQWAVGND